MNVQLKIDKWEDLIAFSEEIIHEIDMHRELTQVKELSYKESFWDIWKLPDDITGDYLQIKASLLGVQYPDKA